ALQAAYASLDIGASTRLEHPITLATGEARRVRHALQRVREDGRDQVLAVLVALGPAHPNDADEAPAADGLDAPLLASLGQALRGPLTTLLDEADTLTRTPRLDTEDYQGAARQIAAEGRRLMATLNLVVDLARIESGEASLVRSDLLLGHELRKVVGLLEPLATKRDLVLDADLDAADHIAVHQDPIALSRVLHHLVGTAIAEVSPGVLRIRVRHSARSASIELEGTTTSDHALSAAVMHQPFGGAIAERLVARMAGSLTESKDDEACRWTLTLPTVERMPATTASVIASPAAVSEQAVAKMEGFATDMPDSGTPDVGTPDVAAPGIEALEVELPEKVDVDSAEGPASPVVPEAADMLNALPSALDETEDEALEAEAFAMPPADTLPSPDFEEAPVPSLPDLDALFPMPNGGDGGPRSEEPEEPEAPRRPRHAFPSIEAAANAFLLADDLHFSARPLVHRDTSAGAATPPGAAEPAGAAEAGVEQTDSSRPAPRYERTEVPLPVGVRLSTPSAVHNEEPAVAPQAPDEEATPPSSVPTADTAPRAFDTALDAFASVEAEHIDVSDLDPADDEVSRLASKVDAPPAGSHEGPGSQPPRLAVEGPARVLIVEDNSETRILLERLIGREFETVAVESPRAALDQLTQQQFHALVLDIHLGGRETGVDILRIARTLDGYADTFAMAVTAFGERSDRERFIEAGFNAYVQKPFVPEALLAPLREALQPA
ncbi:MAG: response regulator, partial [Bacteroidota bacterium]